MTRDSDDFEGIDISGPWGGVRIGSAFGDSADDGDRELRAVRRSVRRRLDLYRHAAWYAIIIAALAIIDGVTGGGWWVWWVAGIWGAFLAMQALSVFGVPTFFGRDTEERMVREEMERRRGRVTVTRPPHADDR